MPDPAWMARANCRGLDPDLFHPHPTDDQATPMAVCSGCTVRAECLDYAVADPRLRGIWGGTGEKPRQALRKLRKLRQEAI